MRLSVFSESGHNFSFFLTSSPKCFILLTHNTIHTMFEMNYTVSTDNKRTALFWAAVTIIAGISILLGVMMPGIFTFWTCFGVFLAGVGFTAFIIDTVMKKPGFPTFPTVLFVAGILILAGNLLGSLGKAVDFNIGGFLAAMALIIIGIAVAISVLRRKY